MQPRKQHLVDTALTLFNQYGYHATGIDLILAQSKVSKATLYKHFRSKDELILAVLEQRHNQILAMFNSKVEQAALKGSHPLLGIFDALDEWFNSDEFYGCNFINASAEYAASLDPIHVFAAQHKQAIVDLIKTQLTATETNQAEQISLLIEGAIVMAHTRGIKNSALTAKIMAQYLISTS
ncbi:TetR/AcrR family transcriptional regulator [Paraglaciecola marina]|uniref:TetR/AcrR family transcriptional regulator n=1 Tax=Paraglaciecola marina TaxID=2500157 RepID=UPI00105E8ED5|nr:TetR/AcrR family transcriptional regulator [Paraglaciecola marina]